MIRRLSSTRLTAPAELPAIPEAQQREIENVRVLPAERTARKPSPLPLHTIRIPKLDADLLLPARAATPEATLALYRERLEESRIFSERETRLIQAVQKQVEESPAVDPSQPVVGIIASGPIALLGGRRVCELCREMNELGMRVVLIPPCADLLLPDDPVGRADAIRSMLRGLDGLIGPGGPDIDPSLYGQENRYAQSPNLRRDRFEADLALLAKRESLFMFGICRSHQLWNAADGGSLVQDIVEEGLVSYPLRQKVFGIPSDQPMVLRNADGEVVYENRIQLDPNSRMAEVTKQTEFLTNANHHESLEYPGVDLEVVGRLKDHQIVEATERWNTFTVQWHPESMWNDPIQHRLLATVGRRAALFRAAKRLEEEKKPVNARALETWYTKRFGVLDQSDLRWIRRDLIPHWFGSAAQRASNGTSYAT